MKRVSLLVVLVALLWGAGNADAAAATQKPAPRKVDEAAKALTTITGIAISPLLGTGVVGAWEWFQADTPQARAGLPWYGQIWYWLPALLLVAAVAAKDILGTATPPGLKKPLDVAETIENKVSGLVAAGVIIPFAAAIFPMFTDNQQAMTGGMPVLLAGFNFSGLFSLLTVPFALTAYVLVWLLSHTINVLILLSPWGGVDVALKAVRAALLGSLVLVAKIDPVVGALLSLVVIVLAYLLAGWSFRLLVCGLSFIWDFVSLRRCRFSPQANANWMFTAKRIGRTPTRTYGRLVRTPAGGLRFEYRPWLVGKPTAVDLPSGTYAVGRGLFYSEILWVDGEQEQMLLLLPPRYRSHEDQLLPIYGLVEVRDTGLRRTWQWIKSLLGFSQPSPAQAL